MKNRMILAALALGSASGLAAAITPLEFQNAVEALHKQQIASQTVREQKEAPKRYNGSAAARYRYVDTRYFDESNRLLAYLRRDAAKPHHIHIIEVNVYDEAGRVLRDYGSIAHPWAPKLPSRSMISLHGYNGQLHSFRQFDVTGEVIYESCQGTLDGKPVKLSLEPDDISSQLVESAAYRACFQGVDTDATKYLKPF